MPKVYLEPAQLTCLSIDKQAANVDGCKVVSIDWLLDCEKSKKRLKENKYFFGVDPAKDASQAVDTSQATDGAVDDVSANKKKSSKKRSQSANVDADSDQPPPNKKQKDGQKAKAKSLNVPVDERCHLKRKSRNFAPLLFVL